MRIQTVSVLTIFLVFVPALEAQRRGGGIGGPGRPSGAPANQAARIAAQRPLPSTPILPMTNPIGPVVPYGGAGRLLNGPTQLPQYNLLSRIERRRDVPVVYGAPYWSPYYGPYLRRRSPNFKTQLICPRPLCPSSWGFLVRDPPPQSGCKWQ